MRVNRIDVTRSQLGWACAIYFSVTTASQFSDEYLAVSGFSRWLVAATWKAWRNARALYCQRRARPGEREAKGWSA